MDRSDAGKRVSGHIFVHFSVSYLVGNIFSCHSVDAISCRVIAGGSPRFQDSSKIVLLIIATAMVPAFIFWMSRQERLNKPALIPNSLWKNTSFLKICVLVLLSWAVLQSMGWFLSLL